MNKIDFFSIGNEAEAIRLLELGMNANTPDQYGNLPMHLAAERGSNMHT